MSFLKKLGLLFSIINFIALFSSSILAQALSVSVDIIPRATYTLNELYIMIEERQNLEHIGSITIQNNTDLDYQVKLRVQLFTDKFSLSEPIADYVTNYDNFSIDVPGNGVFYIDNVQITEAMAKGGQQIIPKEQVEDNIKNTFGDDVVLKTAGLVPEGRYVYKLYVYDKSDTSLSNPLATVVEEVFDIPLEDGVIEINTPENNVTLFENYPINFIWQNLLVRPGVNIYYTFKLWEKGGYLTEEVIGLDPLFQQYLETPFQDFFSYNSNYVELVKGKTYVWQITAEDEAGYPIGTMSASLPYSFTFGSKEQINIDGITTFDDYPLIFSWDGDPNLEYDLLFSKDENFLNSLQINPAPIQSNQYRLDYLPTDYFPGANYYWKVRSYVAEEVLESNLGSFRVKKQIINLLAPVNEEVSLDYIQFLWEANTTNKFKLTISDSQNLSNPLEILVDSNTYMLSGDDLNLTPGKSYYWKVVELNSNDDEVAASEVETFNTPQPLAPELFYPIEDQLVSDKVVFNYKNLPWATSYTVVLKKDGIVIGRFKSDITNVEVELSQFLFDENTTFKWYVEAENQVFGLSSTERTLIYKKSSQDSTELSNLITLAYPLNSKVNGNNVNFQWNGKLNHNYIIEVSDSEDFSNPLSFSVKNQLSTKQKVDFVGKVYWKVSSLDQSSEVGVFIISDDLSNLTNEQKISIQNMIISRSKDTSSLKEGTWVLQNIKTNDDTTVNDLKYLSENFESLIKVIEL